MMKAQAAENSITTVKGPAGLELVLWAGAVLRADYGAEESLMLRMHRKTRRSAQKASSVCLKNISIHRAITL